MKILVPHPHLKPHHVKHVAALTTISGGGAEVFLPYHIGTLMFCIAGLLAIYEPMLVHHVELEIRDDE